MHVHRYARFLYIHLISPHVASLLRNEYYHTIYISTFHTFTEKFLILLGAMDPNGSYPNISPLPVAMDPSGSYLNIFPLHEALRGTTAMSILKSFVAFESPSSVSPSIGNSSPTIHAPQGATVMSVNERSMVPYQSHTDLAPLPP